MSLRTHSFRATLNPMPSDKPLPRGAPIPHREGLVSDGAGGSMTIAQWRHEQEVRKFEEWRKQPNGDGKGGAKP
jgi:hypothetical protein